MIIHNLTQGSPEWLAYREVNAQIYVVVTSTGGAGYSSGHDGAPKHPGGPLVMETDVDGASLEMARERAAMFERRFGACRIGRVVFEDEPAFLQIGAKA